MTSAAHQAWLNKYGGTWYLIDPLVYLRDELRKVGYTVYDIGNDSHLDHSPPEDHTPYSATGWPGESRQPYVHAIDIMPSKGMADLTRLARRMIADKEAGIAQFIKYMNWTDENGSVWHTSWQPSKRTVPSGDGGHIHLSARTDYWNSGIKYSPLTGGGGGGFSMLSACKFGDKGDAVFALQATLLAYGFNPGDVDGDYGAKTASALAASIRDGDGKNFGYWEFAAFMKRVISAGGQGPKGDKGDPGAPGKDGAPGVQGPPGDAAVLPVGAVLKVQ